MMPTRLEHRCVISDEEVVITSEVEIVATPEKAFPVEVKLHTVEVRRPDGSLIGALKEGSLS